MKRRLKIWSRDAGGSSLVPPRGVLVALSALLALSTVFAVAPNVALAACEEPQGVYYSFDRPTTFVSEAAGEVYVPVRMRTSDGCAVRHAASVGFATGGTVSDDATAGVDYQSAGAGSPRLDFFGKPSNTVFYVSPAGFHTAIINDAVHEPSETFSVHFVNPVNCVAGWGPGLPASPPYTYNFIEIRDDDAPQTLYMAFKYGDREVNESVGLVKVVVQFTTSNHQPSQCPAKVSYTTADDLGGPNPPANAGLDYTTTSGEIIFGPNTRDGAELSIDVPIIDDGVGEPGIEVLNVTLSDAVSQCGIPAHVGARFMYWINIADDDAAAITDVYRMFNPSTAEHLYTTDLNEYNVLAGAGWIPEGRTFGAFSTPGLYQGLRVIPLFRVWHGGIAQHLWTTDPYEYLMLPNAAWSQEGSALYVLPAGSGAYGALPLYRLAYPQPSLHLWTIDFNEYSYQGSHGWSQEGQVADVLP